MRTLLSWFETDVADGCKLITTTWANTKYFLNSNSNETKKVKVIQLEQE